MDHNPNRYFSTRKFLIVFGTRITRITRISCLKTKDSLDSRDSCSKIQHSTLNKDNGFTKLHQAGVSPALFSGFRPGRGKSPSDEMDKSRCTQLYEQLLKSG